MTCHHFVDVKKVITLILNKINVFNVMLHVTHVMDPTMINVYHVIPVFRVLYFIN